MHSLLPTFAHVDSPPERRSCHSNEVYMSGTGPDVPRHGAPVLWRSVLVYFDDDLSDDCEPFRQAGPDILNESGRGLNRRMLLTV